MPRDFGKNVNGKFWRGFTFFLIVASSCTFIVMGIFLNPYILLNPGFGSIYLTITLGVVVYCIYDYHRIKMYVKCRINFKSKLLPKAIRFLILMALTLEIPIVLNNSSSINSVIRESSPYDTYVGTSFDANITTLVYSTIPGVPSAHCSNLIYLPRTGDVLCSWYAGAGEKEPDVAIWASRCHPNMTWEAVEEADLDLNWSYPVVIADTIDKSEGQPVFYLCPNGRLYLFFQTLKPTEPMFVTWGPVLEAGWSLAKIKYQYSDDNGYNWSTPIYFWNFYFWCERNPLLKTRDGNVLFPMESEGTAFFLIFRNQNLEGSWHRSAILRAPGSLSQPCLAELDSGRILSVFRTGNGKIYKSYSNDGGFDWEKARPMRFPNPDSCVSLLKLDDGRLLMLCNPLNGRHRLSFILGDETGIYWSEPSPVRDEPKEFSYPCMIQLPDQSIIFSYTNNRENIGSGRFTINALNHMAIDYERAEL